MNEIRTRNYYGQITAVYGDQYATSQPRSKKFYRPVLFTQSKIPDNRVPKIDILGERRLAGIVFGVERRRNTPRTLRLLDDVRPRQSWGFVIISGTPISYRSRRSDDTYVRSKAFVVFRFRSIRPRYVHRAAYCLRRRGT